ncbi:MAG TPA: NAD-dependent epimerase/dehydratase family protein [Capillimicrobium sp.]|nr:NAD-dependent epimerase/dehydratase family protein [Capillimicrobium sp.]
MRILILGGTVFLGRWTAAEALRRGHDVTLLHRGRHGRDLFPEAEHLIADRTGDLSVLRGRSWDAAIDTSGYAARDVAASSEALAAGGLEHLTFVSTCNAYPDWPERPVDEDSPVWDVDDGEYGPAKAACERAARAALDDRVAVVRAGLIVGPHDNVFRLPWWVARVARGGEMLAPGTPERSLQLIDARDLAAFMVDLAERRQPGTFNGTAPIGSTTFGAVLDAARAASGSDAEPRWVDDVALEEAGVEPWTELPLWIPPRFAGTWAVGTDRAQAAGLRHRPIEETVADVWAWLADGGAERLPDWQVEHRARGLDPARERELLAQLR